MKKGEVNAIAASPIAVAGDKAATMRYITAEVKRLDGYELLLVGDAKGEYYTTNNQSANNADREYFKKVMATGKTYVSDPLVAHTTVHNVVIIAAPIMKNGRRKRLGHRRASRPIRPGNQPLPRQRQNEL